MTLAKAIFDYFFNTQPGTKFNFYIPLLILATVILLLSVVFILIYKKKKKDDIAFKFLFQKFSSRLLIIVILILFFVAVRYENIAYFSMRIWLYLTLLAFLYLIFHYARIYKVVYPKEKFNVDQKMRGHDENQYLPNKNKRR